MHDIKNIRNDIQSFKIFLKKRFLDINVDKILKLDENNRKYIQEKEAFEKEKKTISKSKDKALSNKASLSLTKTNLEPVVLVARSKSSIFRDSPNSKCDLGLNLNSRMFPFFSISTLCASSVPIGTS